MVFLSCQIFKSCGRQLQIFKKPKESDAFGHSGDEIVGRLLIPWGHYKVGAKNFQALL